MWRDSNRGVRRRRSNRWATRPLLPPPGKPPPIYWPVHPPSESWSTPPGKSSPQDPWRAAPSGEPQTSWGSPGSSPTGDRRSTRTADDRLPPAWQSAPTSYQQAPPPPPSHWEPVRPRCPHPIRMAPRRHGRSSLRRRPMNRHQRFRWRDGRHKLKPCRGHRPSSHPGDPGCSTRPADPTLVAPPPTNLLTQPPPANLLTQPRPANPLTQPPPTNLLTQPPAMTQSAPGGPQEPGSVPERGDLDIHERRTWKTWQLLVAVLIAIVLGMGINGVTGSSGSGTAGGTSSHGSYKLPPASGSTSGAPAGASSATSTTAAGGSTTTTVAGGSTSTTAAPSTGTATVLIPQTVMSGNWTSTPFTIASGTWNIGWAFQCTPAPPTSPTFAIFVVNAGGSPGSTPAVSSTAASGQSVTPESSTGSQQIIVQTAASCRWAAKVTGIG